MFKSHIVEKQKCFMNVLAKSVACAFVGLALSACLPKEEQATEAKEVITLGVGMARNDDNSPYLQAYYRAFEQNAAANPDIKMLIEDAKNDQDTQFKQLDEMIAKGAKGLAVNLVDYKRGGESVARYCNKVFLVYVSNPGGRELASCADTYHVQPDLFSAGVVQGREILKQWAANPEWDKNGDRSIQIAVLAPSIRETGYGSQIAWTLETIGHSPNVAVGTDVLLEGEAFYQTNLAKEVVEKWIEEPNFSEVELVVVGSDSMSFGVLEVFKANGIQLPIFSFDALPEAKKAVERGDLRYTVEYNILEQTKVALLVLENLARGLPASTGLRYPIKDREISIPVKGSGSN